MTLVAQITPLSGGLPRVGFQWNFDTEILTGSIPGPSTSNEPASTIELGCADGCFLSLGLTGRVLSDLEIVVWPKGETVAGLEPPVPDREGRLEVNAVGNEQEAGVAELQVPLVCERSDDRSTIHLSVGEARGIQRVAIAENLIVDIDSMGNLAGFWLTDVPPFPNPGRSK
jgi:hypothetical protein